MRKMVLRFGGRLGSQPRREEGPFFKKISESQTVDRIKMLNDVVEIRIDCKSAQKKWLSFAPRLAS